MGDRAAGSKRRRVPNANPGINLNDEGVPCLFNYYADVFYGTDFETEFASYYEANANEMNNTEVPVEKGEQITGDITPPHLAESIWRGTVMDRQSSPDHGDPSYAECSARYNGEWERCENLKSLRSNIERF